MKKIIYIIGLFYIVTSPTWSSDNIQSIDESNVTVSSTFFNVENKDVIHKIFDLLDGREISGLGVLSRANYYLMECYVSKNINNFIQSLDPKHDDVNNQPLYLSRIQLSRVRESYQDTLTLKLCQYLECMAPDILLIHKQTPEGLLNETDFERHVFPVDSVEHFLKEISQLNFNVYTRMGLVNNDQVNMFFDNCFEAMKKNNTYILLEDMENMSEDVPRCKDHGLFILIRNIEYDRSNIDILHSYYSENSSITLLLNLESYDNCLRLIMTNDLTPKGLPKPKVKVIISSQN
jgi:hypothetical protein